ncbi:MAG: hypothetical protein HRT86_05170 [Ilumatobacteraceae bacterium]|nr:hypothetical protein [Ilumatobacteraceae bacterium]
MSVPGVATPGALAPVRRTHRAVAARASLICRLRSAASLSDTAALDTSIDQEFTDVPA